MADHRYEEITWRGFKFDRWTMLAILASEAYAGIGEWPIAQGSFNPGGVAASAGSHDKAGAVDWLPVHPDLFVFCARFVGCFAAHHRLTLIRNGVRVWGEHIHANLVGDNNASPLAQEQVAAYEAGFHHDGLVDNLPATGPIPNPIHPYFYPSEDPMTLDPVRLLTSQLLAVFRSPSGLVAIPANRPFARRTLGTAHRLVLALHNRLAKPK